MNTKMDSFLCTITIDKNIGIYYNNTIETTLKTNKTYNSGGFPNEKNDETYCSSNNRNGNCNDINRLLLRHRKYHGSSGE